jgi:prenyltransferase beta subunit
VLTDSAATVEELTAACRLLEIATGFKEVDRQAVSTQVDSKTSLLGGDSYKLVPLLNAAALAPSEDLRAILRTRSEYLSLTDARMDSLLELAHLHHILGQDSPIAPDTIADAVLALLSTTGSPQSGGFRSDMQTGYAGVRSTLAALEALDLVGGLMRVDADAVRGYILDCWITPGFAAVSPWDDTDTASWVCTDLSLTYAGTETLAILENRDVPDR